MYSTNTIPGAFAEQIIRGIKNIFYFSFQNCVTVSHDSVSVILKILNWMGEREEMSFQQRQSVNKIHQQSLKKNRNQVFTYQQCIQIRGANRPMVI